MKLFRTFVAAGGAVAAVSFGGDCRRNYRRGREFPFPIYAKWADAYKKESGVGLNYQSIGSGGGIEQIKAKTVTFGATDTPLKAEGLDSRPRPIPDGDGRHRAGRQCGGIEPGDLSGWHDSGRIFLGKIENWDDPAIDKLNPNVNLPNRRSPSCTVPTVRAPPSISPTISREVSPSWKTKVGVDTSVDWPAGIGAKGNEGVANNVANTKGSIGYVEYAYAKQNHLAYVKMINKAGKTVAPTSKPSRPPPPMPTGRRSPATM